MKRGSIGVDRTRIAPPGRDVDSAAPHQLLLHEDFFYSQPFLWRWVPCPFAGYTGPVAQDAMVGPIAFDSNGTVPGIITYIVFDDGQTTYPARNAIASLAVGVEGSLLRDARVQHSLTESAVTLRFTKRQNSNLSPSGCYLVLFRRGRDNG